MNFKGKDCVIHVPHRLAGMDGCVDNSCKRRAEYLRHSLVIVCRECGQWQTSFIQEKLACLAEVSVTADFTGISKFPEILGKLSMRKQCVPGSFVPAHTREPGNEARDVCTTS